MASYQEWLQQASAQYQFPAKVGNEIDSALRVHHSLRPQCNIYTLPNGGRSSLICLIGTIPVSSLQNMNRVIAVPVEICLPFRYPAELPMVWVRPGLLPTPPIPVMIRVTSECDANGVVRFPVGQQFGSLHDIVSFLQGAFRLRLPIVSTNQGISPPFLQRPPPMMSHSHHPQKPVHSQSQPHIQQMPPLSGPPLDSSHAPASVLPPLAELQQLQISHPLPPSGPIEELKAAVLAGFGDHLNDNSKRATALLKQKTELEEGQRTLEREKLVLRNETALVTKEIDLLDGKLGELERKIKIKTNSSGIVTAAACGQAIVTPDTPMSSQILDLLANDAALSDALLILIKNISSRPTTTTDAGFVLTVNLREIRELSRKQFLTRVHLKKIVQ